MAHSFHVKSTDLHMKWNRANPPVITVPSGAEISFDLRDGGNNQIRPDNEATALADFDFSLTDPGFGPVYVEGAEPGDVLRVEVLEAFCHAVQAKVAQHVEGWMGQHDLLSPQWK